MMLDSCTGASVRQPAYKSKSELSGLVRSMCSGSLWIVAVAAAFGDHFAFSIAPMNAADGHV